MTAGQAITKALQAAWKMPSDYVGIEHLRLVGLDRPAFAEHDPEKSRLPEGVELPADDVLLPLSFRLEKCYKAVGGSAPVEALLDRLEQDIREQEERISETRLRLLEERNILGRAVRDAWVARQRLKPGISKPEWDFPFDQLTEFEQETDRQIAESVLRCAENDPSMKQVRDRWKEFSNDD